MMRLRMRRHKSRVLRRWRTQPPQPQPQPSKTLRHTRRRRRSPIQPPTHPSLHHHGRISLVITYTPSLPSYPSKNSLLSVVCVTRGDEPLSSWSLEDSPTRSRFIKLNYPHSYYHHTSCHSPISMYLTSHPVGWMLVERVVSWVRLYSTPFRTIFHDSPDSHVVWTSSMMRHKKDYVSVDV